MYFTRYRNVMLELLHFVNCPVEYLVSYQMSMVEVFLKNYNFNY